MGLLNKQPGITCSHSKYWIDPTKQLESLLPSYLHTETISVFSHSEFKSDLPQQHDENETGLNVSCMIANNWKNCLYLNILNRLLAFIIESYS